jgi:phage tail-like protein
MSTTLAENGTGQRGLVPGLATSAPLGPSLPAVLQEDAFCTRMSLAFDESFAPILSTLDCLTAYLDPALAPPDFLQWLGGWVGLDIDETWPVERRRMLVSEAIELYRIRGTREGLSRLVALYAGATPEIDESGGCAWSQTADTPLPGSAEPQLVVRLNLPSAGWVEATVVERIVRSARPAHIPQQVEVRAGQKQIQTQSSLDIANEAEEESGVLGGHIPEAQPPSVASVEVGPGVPDRSDAFDAEPLKDEPEPDP